MTADFTTLKVSKELTSKLKQIGTKGETYEDIIWPLIVGSKKEKEKRSAKKVQGRGEASRRHRTSAKSNHCERGGMEIQTR